MKRKADVDRCKPKKRARKDGARTKAEITRVSAEMSAQGPHAERDGHLHSEPKSGRFEAGARAKIGAGRIRAKRSIGSDDSTASATAVTDTTEREAERLYAEGEGHVHLEAKSGAFKVGAGATAKISAGRVTAKRSIGSAGANSSNASAMVVANTTRAAAIVEMERPCAEAEANINVEITPAKYDFEANVRAKASAGQISVKEDDVSAEANGPNASATFVANNREAKVMVGAEIASASVSAGPVGVKVGLGVETGVRVGEDGAEVKVMGCGVSVGRTMGVSLFGSELKFKLW